MSAIDEVLAKLHGVKGTGKNSWAARCPCRNDDDNPSLSIGIGRDGRVLLNCHRGENACGAPEICEAMGLTMADLHDEKPKKAELKLVDTYVYIDENGEVLFRKQKYIDEANGGKKTFRQQRHENGSWVSGRGQARPVLFNLPEVKLAIEGQLDIWVVEGEKDVEAVNGTGRVATTMPDGAGHWQPLHTAQMKGAKRVIVLADNDDIGIEHAWSVHDALEPVVGKVLVVMVPEGKDAFDWIHKHGGDLSDCVPINRPGSIELPVIKDDFSEIVEGLVALASMDVPASQKLMKARNLIDRADVHDEFDRGRLVAWTDFVAETTEDSYDWVIPGVLERQERVIVVAAEGVGKTTLARQVAICTAAGLQPFTRSAMDPITTLFVDLENPERIIRRMSRDIVGAAQRYRPDKKAPINAHLLMKPDGMNLLDAPDRILLEETIEATKPDLLVIGPLYKAFVDPGGRTSESVAVETAKYLDYLRWTYGCALWMEHHAPLGGSGGRDMRPFGSAVWSRWPEFGLTIVPDHSATEPNHFEVGTFRGSRDVRHWPTKIKYGAVFPFDALEYVTTS